MTIETHHDPDRHREALAMLGTASVDARLSEPFYGSVLLHSCTHLPWLEYQANGFTGFIQVIPAKDLMGTEVNSRDSNWAVLVSGKTTTIGVPGCQIRMVMRRNDPGQPWDSNPSIVEVP